MAVPQALEARLSQRLAAELNSAIPPGFYAESNRRAAALANLALTRFGYEL
jgi:hypothetical protein